MRLMDSYSDLVAFLVKINTGERKSDNPGKMFLCVMTLKRFDFASDVVVSKGEALQAC